MARYDLAEVIAKKRNGRQLHLRLPDDTILKVDPLELWSDEVLTFSRTDQVKAAKALLGESDYAKFTAAGGCAALLLTLVNENQEVTKGEAKPSPS